MQIVRVTPFHLQFQSMPTSIFIVEENGAVQRICLLGDQILHFVMIERGTEVVSGSQILFPNQFVSTNLLRLERKARPKSRRVIVKFEIAGCTECLAVE